MGWAEDAAGWFAEHNTTRKFVKVLIFAALGFIVSEQASLIAMLPTWAVVPATALIAALANWLQYNTTLPIVGGKKK